jgi:hypothetical protein
MPRPDIFGVRLAKTLDTVFKAARGSFPAVLITHRKGERDPLEPTAGRAITTTRIACRGFMDEREIKASDGAPARTGRTFVIFGNSLPLTVEPLPGDKIESSEEGKTFSILEDGVKRDPAGALYECNVGP